MSEAKQAIGPNQEKWLKALESGEYVQCQGTLGLVDKDGTESNCCLGVACRVLGSVRHVSDHGTVTYDGCMGAPSDDFALDVLGLKSQQGDFRGCDHELNGRLCLTEANDYGEATFAQIAAFCREYPEAVFREPR